MIKAVVFDLDGVYFENGTAAFFSALQETYQLDQEAIKEVYFRSKEMQRYKEGLLSGDDFWAFAISSWNIRATKDELISLLVEGYRESRETILFIKHLREKGIRTAICTNNFRERMEGLEERFHFRQWFDVVVTSYEEGARKPDALIFKILTERLRLTPEEILVSDDIEANVTMLKRLGFSAFFYTDFGAFREKVLALT